MTNEEIEVGNRLIAEFMGYKLVTPDMRSNPSEWKLSYWENPEFKGSSKGVLCSEKGLSYHCSWNWLMKVVEKIESLKDTHHGYFGVHISSNSCSIQGTNLWMALKDSSYGYVYMSDPNAIFSTKLESTWYNVVKFIKWYNDNIQ